MPDPSCCSSPDPEPSGPDDRTVDWRRDLIDCILDDSRNGTLLEVFGMEPPCFWEYNKGDFFGRLVGASCWQCDSFVKTDAFGIIVFRLVLCYVQGLRCEYV
ncbi:hypothetical protein M5D96_006264 [Drosophila gunungcola]|uniref:Uncharacterized protein n=1 Tax=Drosophila gunungcola TaxID=103775 RepID=A0A9Q0BQR2_9MUSC|nr:hypothetical protein M5D96_006264 [Drosophila gunungcola]